MVKENKGINGNSTRLYVKSVFLGYRRSRRSQNTNQALLKIQHVNCKNDVNYYLGKRAAYVYKGKSDKSYRAIWGKICRPHGDNGVVIARFNSNLPPRAIGAQLRVMLYPQRA